MKLSPTRVLVWLVLAAVAAAFVWAFRPKPQEVAAAAVERGPLQVTLDEEGQTRVRDRYVLSAPLAGKVLRIEHEPGDRVRTGSTILARFQPSTPEFLNSRTRAEAQARVARSEAEVERSRVDLDRARAELDHARSELTRHQQLHTEGLMADDRLESARLRAVTAHETVRAAESAIVVADLELERARTSLIEAGAASADSGDVIILRSPITGVVLRRLRESESVVPAGEPLIEIGNPEDLEIVSDMLSMDAVQIDTGDPVLIEQWGGETTLRGVVRQVEPFGFTKISALGVEEQRVNVIVDFEDPRAAWEALGDGYRVEIRVVVWEKANVLKVPSSSLFRNGDQWAVYVIDEPSVARLREVEIGRRNALEAEVLAGLQPGDQVIGYPGDTVEDGIEVLPTPL